MLLKSTIFKYALYVLLLCSSLIVILNNFPNIPKYLFFDEVEFAKLSLSLQQQSYTPYSELATGHSTLYFYILLIFFKLLGVSNFSLRLPSALFGVISVFIFFEIMKIVFWKNNENKKNFTYLILPFLLSIIFLTLRWYFNFARFSFEATFLLALELSSIYFFLKFIKEKNLIFVILSGIFAGLAFHSYYPGRIFFLLPLLFLVVSYRKYIFTYVIAFLIISSPLVLYLTTHPDKRFDEQFFIRNQNYSIQKKLGYLTENSVKLATMFTIKSDMNGRHNYPGKASLNPIVSGFFIFGLVITLMKRKYLYNQIFLTYFFLSLIPSLFSSPYENPNMLRTVTTIPAIVYFIGNGIRYILSIVNNNLKKYLIIFIFIFFLFSIYYELRTYYVFQAPVFEQDASKVKGDLKNIIILR